jgi:hypothetical protein
MTTATAIAAASVNSSAISHLAIVPGDLQGTFDLLVTYTSSSTEYRFAFEDHGAAVRWTDLLQDPEAREATSWGRLLHRALQHGDLERI